MSSRIVAIACGFLVIIGAGTETVIASVPDVDQAAGTADLAADSWGSYWHLLILGFLAFCALWIWVRFRWISLPAQRIPDGHVDAMGGALGGFGLAFIMLVLATLGRGIAQGAFDLDADPNLRTMFILMFGALIAQLPIAIYFFIKCADRKSLVMPRIIKICGFGLFGFILVLPVVLFVLDVGATLRLLWTGVEDDGVAHSGLSVILTASDRAYLLPVLLLVILITPLLEEILYRGFVQRGFRTLGLPPWAAILAASLPFTMMHVGVVEPAALAGLFVLSMGLGWVYERGGSIMAPIVLHSCFNGFNTAYALLIPAC